MNRQTVERIVRAAFKQQFSLFTDSYRLNQNGTVPRKTRENVALCAELYFENRTQSEIECHERLGVKLEDHIKWCKEEFAELCSAPEMA